MAIRVMARVMIKLKNFKHPSVELLITRGGRNQIATCKILLLACIQDTLSSRAALGLPAFRPSASRELRYLAYNLLARLYARYFCSRTRPKAARPSTRDDRVSCIQFAHVLCLYARYLCSRDALGLKAMQPLGQARARR